MKNTIMFLRICFIFPNREEINQPEKNVFIKFTIIYIIGIYFPIGIALHVLMNIRSKCYSNLSTFLYIKDQKSYFSII